MILDLSRAKGYSMYRHARAKIRWAAADLPLKSSKLLVAAHVDDGDMLFVPVCVIGPEDGAFIRVLAERGIFVTN